MMAGYAALIAPFALLAPFVAATPAQQDSPVQQDSLPRYVPALSAEGVSSKAPTPSSNAKRSPDLAALPSPAAAPTGPDLLKQQQRVHQIRIEKRVIIRITPQRGRNRQNLIAQLPQRALNARYKERETGKCVPVKGISAVETGSGNRLLLFMRDAKIMSLNLEKACRARDFYSGFYVERNKDGKLCVERDRLQSRNGVRCQINRMTQLVAIRD